MYVGKRVSDAVSQKYGWEILKPPMTLMCAKCLSEKVEQFCDCLMELSPAQLDEQQ